MRGKASSLTLVTSETTLLPTTGLEGHEGSFSPLPTPSYGRRGPMLCLSHLLFPLQAHALMLPLIGSSLLCCPGKVQGPLSSSAPDEGHGQFSHPPQVARKRGEHLSVSLTTTWQTRGAGLTVPLSQPQGRLTCAPTSRVGTTMVPG